MKVVFNGQPIELSESCTLKALLSDDNVTKGVPLEQAVVAVNQNFVHRETYDEVVISEGDEVEMLTAVVGG